MTCSSPRPDARNTACCNTVPAAPSGQGDVALPDAFKALAHSARLEILQVLATCETACCGDLVKRLPLAQSTVSQHLGVLRAAGLVGMRGDGRCCHYHLEPQALARLAADVEGLFAAFRQPPAPARAQDTQDRMAPERRRKDPE
ncbi:ArsR/SmtB family transcription factor [Stappia stellulata]|uniref:ArsR/SmtB family transcription factor n=1 Tax=Stappia stellulata TaxID=71235 RepID=UPI000A066920|nr:metalloregulator ArsR/SmtB family transcription factor [Stappia stellulata]